MLRNLPKTVIKMGLTCQDMMGPERAAAMTLAKCEALEMQACYAESVVLFTNAVREYLEKIYPKETQRYKNIYDRWMSCPEEIRDRVKKGLAPTNAIAELRK